MIAQWQKPRDVSRRIRITGILELETPTHLGNGDADGPLDMPLHLDPLEGKPLLTGASLAGALRNYIGFIQDAKAAEALFGYVDDKASNESRLIVDDALAQQSLNAELRDGVSIEPETRTAEDEKKFDIELLAAGTTFPIRMELNLPRDSEKAESLKQSLAWALKALETGKIRLGKRKRRGFGKVKVTAWQVDEYDMTTADGLEQWLKSAVAVQPPSRHDDILKALAGGDEGPSLKVADLKATFKLDGSLLIRSAVGDGAGPDFEHLKSFRPGATDPQPVLSGTSAAGAMRARALRIANTLGMDGRRVVDRLFGYRPKNRGDKTPLTASRIWVEETVIEEPLELVHTRVAIDRFTGGAYPGALFSEQPLFGKEETRVEIRCWIPRPEEWEVGLLLLLLKDLWTGDLPLGGEASVGRGRLQGIEATLVVHDRTWVIRRAEGNALTIEGGTPADLEHFLNAFLTHADRAKRKQEAAS